MKYFQDAHLYSSGRAQVVRGGALDGMANGSTAIDDEDSGDAAPAPAAKAAKAAPLSSKDEQGKLRLSHRSILLLHLMIVIGQIPDRTALLVQYLAIALHTGDLPGVEEMKRITITGEQLLHRSRQLSWGLRQEAWSDIQQSNALAFSMDASILVRRSLMSRIIYYMAYNKDLGLMEPRRHVLPHSPAHGKGADAEAEGFLTAAEADGCTDFTHLQRIIAAANDNAPAAVNAAFLTVDKIDLRVSGADDSGEVVRPTVNGVPRRLFDQGSPLHKVHLFMKAFRGASVGGKTDMDDPNHLQMIYKWRAVLVADEVSSGESVAMEVFRDALGSNANVTMITQEHEGRWTLSYQACVAVKSLLDTKSGLLNGLSMAALQLRSILTPGCWAISACKQVATWSHSPEIYFAITLEIEFGKTYFTTMNWLRASPQRPHLAHYGNMHKMRELVGHWHRTVIPRLRETKDNPEEHLPETFACIASDLFLHDEKEPLRQRVRDGLAAAWKSMAKH
ncbi:MAG TPA: hypothetical protein RMH80_12790, partial [Polyangiaceae bacterium LLY-WYZ-15_(1-7)]|nr:hypothetical protein [Polyangiaceae bacterium LLY-WYZ-15_(1-7)]